MHISILRFVSIFACMTIKLISCCFVTTKQITGHQLHQTLFHFNAPYWVLPGTHNLQQVPLQCLDHHMQQQSTTKCNLPAWGEHFVRIRKVMDQHISSPIVLHRYFLNQYSVPFTWISNTGLGSGYRVWLDQNVIAILRFLFYCDAGLWMETADTYIDMSRVFSNWLSMKFSGRREGGGIQLGYSMYPHFGIFLKRGTLVPTLLIFNPDFSRAFFLASENHNPV